MELRLNKILTILSAVFFFSTFSSAGTFQGGGGGKSNASIKRYLDKRIYGLDGAKHEVAPQIMLVNACIENDMIHTIEPVWQCKKTEAVEEKNSNKKGREKAANNCDKKVKKHIKSKIREAQRVCEDYEAQVLKDQIKEVCVKFSEDKVNKFKTKYRLDVYQLSIGNGGNALQPRADRDNFLRTVEYTIPNCEELDIN